MASIILGQAMSVIGGAIGSSVGAAIGYGIGTFVGGYIDNQLFSRSNSSKTVGSRLADLTIQTSTYGKTIPILYGVNRIAGNVIWSLPIREHEVTTSEEIGGKGGGGGREVIHSNYYYTVTLAIALGEGPIDGIISAFADAARLNLTYGKYRLYKGTEDQLPDSLIESYQGVGTTPAYRGLAYIIIEDFPLGNYGNRIPNFTFEVKRSVIRHDNKNPPLEDLIKSIVMLPGSGEFVYDTCMQAKLYGGHTDSGLFIPLGKQQKINQNSGENKSDAILSLEQLQNSCQNLEWVAPVVTWFCNSTLLENATIKPGVEYKGGVITSPDLWKVSKYTRDTAYMISKDAAGHPNYGGSINDLSIVRYLEELKRRNLKIMFYPMFFMDTPQKPWRGRLTGLPHAVREFFIQPQGYNEFILHYAKLLVGKVDAFVIGSELIGLTRIRDHNNKFPAVEELIKLAEEVKTILGNNVIITYAADWSEYHHTEGGWYNLDPLWASSSIDVIGIDAYFPITEGSKSSYSEEEVINGWHSGEGYEYYYDGNNRNVKHPLSPEYAWKNIEYWWKNDHLNPDGSKTAWKPKSKKIWFTEYGFPSVDGATNQPNVFYDPTSSESKFPIYSRGKVGFATQRLALTATEKKWKHSEMVDRLFLWCWDARPYPFWPNLMNVWRDGGAWKFGHWVNGKLGLSSLGAIILDLCKRVGLAEYDIDVSSLKHIINGYVITDKQEVRSSIELLQQAYGFDIIESDGKIKFTLPIKSPVLSVKAENLVVQENQQEVLIITRTQELDLPKKFEVLYIDKGNNYEQNLEMAEYMHTSSCAIEAINLPIVLDRQAAKNIAEVNLYNSWAERTHYRFCLAFKYINLEPGDVVNIITNTSEHKIKITNLCIGNNYTLQICGKSENILTYESDFSNADINISSKNNIPAVILSHTEFDILDIPLLPTSLNTNACIYIAATSNERGWRGANILYSRDQGINYYRLSTIIKPAVMGSVYNKLAAGPITHFDYMNFIIVFLIHGELETVPLSNVLNGANFAIIGNEIIQFTTAELIEPFKYKLSGLLRGCLNTEEEVNNHSEGERFILLDHRIKQIDIPYNLINNNILCRAMTIGNDIEDTALPSPNSFVYKGMALKPFSPVRLKYSYNSNNKNIKISWVRRVRISSNWSDNTDIPLFEDKEVYDVEVIGKDNEIIESKTVYFNECNFDYNFLYTYCVENYLSSLIFYVYQVSSIVGRGKKAKISVSFTSGHERNL
ncbi:hypothetical protein NOVO_00345 [Rickettsiales bacterium Ac37b]|nr:hypothetical protein NOVO_00345 [Rickettsiales bacterium Ac37b]